MQRRSLSKLLMLSLVTGVLCTSFAPALKSQEADKAKPKLPDQTYMPVVKEKPFEEVMQADVEKKPKLMQRQENLFQNRYDMSDQPSETMMSGGRKAVQEGPGNSSRRRLPNALKRRIPFRMVSVLCRTPIIRSEGRSFPRIRLMRSRSWKTAICPVLMSTSICQIT